MKNKMHRVLMGDGVPTYLNHKPSPAMLSAMRAAMTTSRAYSREHDEETALAYVTWLAARDGLELPKADATRPGWRGYGRTGGHGNILLNFESGWIDGERRGRIRALVWEQGFFSEYRDVQRIRRGKPVTLSERCEPYWVMEKQLLRFEIPNWDHVPAVHETTQQELAA